MTLAAELQTIRERIEKSRKTSGVGFALTTESLALDDLPRLLDAVGAVLRLADALDAIATERSLSARILGPSFKEVARNIRDAITTALEGK